MKGYMGKILMVDLTAGSFEERTIEDHWYEEFLSGVGLAEHILYNEIPAGADPMGPDNILGFVSGLLTGTGSVMTGRWMAVCKSPLTGGWGDANCGGNLSPAIKQCGYDGIFFKGISEKPVYLFVDSKGPKLLDATPYWGKDAVETEDLLEAAHWKTKRPSIAVIGQAGENQSLIAGICNDRGRIAARSGVGAVMGSKKLKAVVLAGVKPIKGENFEAIKKLSKGFSDKARWLTMPGWVPSWVLAYMGKAMAAMKHVTLLDGIMTVLLLKRWGTPMNNGLAATLGDTPIKNWSSSVAEYNKSYYKQVEGDRIVKQEVRKYHCYSCVIGCGGICEIGDVTKGRYEHTHKPEYETCAVFAGLIMGKDKDPIFLLNEMLNRAGMDSISAGHACAFAIECYENGILTKEDTDGLELTWGNLASVVKLLEKMIVREGIGDILADGVKLAAQRIGKGSASYAMHCGGQEPGMHDTRLDPILGVIYSGDATPGRHTTGSAQYYNMMRLWDQVSWAPRIKRYLKEEEYKPTDQEAKKAVASIAYKQLTDGAGGCMYAMITGTSHWNLFDYLNAATGWGKSPDDYMKIGRRMQTTRQLFNIKHGIDPITFKLNDRMAGMPPLTDGPLKDRTVPIDQMLRNFWKQSGWEESTGIPSKETILELGLDQLLKGVS